MSVIPGRSRNLVTRAGGEPMSSAVVTPWRAKICWVSGPDRWTWQSIRPARTKPPSPRPPIAGEIAAIRPPSTTQVGRITEALPVEYPDVRQHGRHDLPAAPTAHSSANANCASWNDLRGGSRCSGRVRPAAGCRPTARPRSRRGTRRSPLVGDPQVRRTRPAGVHRHLDPRRTSTRARDPAAGDVEQFGLRHGGVGGWLAAGIAVGVRPVGPNITWSLIGIGRSTSGCRAALPRRRATPSAPGPGNRTPRAPAAAIRGAAAMAVVTAPPIECPTSTTPGVPPPLACQSSPMASVEHLRVAQDDRTVAGRGLVPARSWAGQRRSSGCRAAPLSSSDWPGMSK